MVQNAKIIKGACPHDCPDQCGWEVEVSNGRALAVRGASSHAFTAGTLCSKLKHFTRRVYSDKRILHPLKRTGRKGDAQFEAVSWETALDDIRDHVSELITQHGPETVLPYSFAGTIGLLQRYAGDLFFRHMGATAVEGDYCGNVAYVGVAQTNGAMVGVLPEDVAYSRYIILWGTNTVVTNLHMWSTIIRKAKATGAKIIVIDPVRTRTAQRADWYLQIRPDTDAALALGMMHAIVRDELHDSDYIARYTLGFEQLRERLAEYPPSRVATITGIAVHDIEALARAFATERPALIRLLVGMERHRRGSEAFRAIACLPALTGAWRDRGGGICHFTTDLFRESLNYEAIQLTDEVPAPTRHVHIAQLGKALMELSDPPVSALFVYNSNPLVSAPNQNLVKAGLQRTDLFTVVHEQFMTDTARYADYVLPATTQIEHYDLMPSWGQVYLTLNQPAIEPLGDAIANTELYRRLAAKMGYTDNYLYVEDPERIRQLLSSDHPYLDGISYETLARDGWARLNLADDWRPLARGEFKSPSGKCEFFSQSLADAGCDPLPTYIPSMDDDDQYPLTLISAKTVDHALNSQYINLQTGRKDQIPTIDITPIDCASRGISDGDTVSVYNARGEVRVKVCVSERTAPGVVSLAFNWWPNTTENGSSANALTADGLSTLGIGSDAFDTRVEVRAA